jgi:transcriptional regulator with XRE-family HTH domain
MTTILPHERMSRARLFAGIDQAQMAHLLGKSRNTISAWERGANVPSVVDVAAWAQVTGRTIDWIVWGDVRPERLELPTFWMGAAPFWTPERKSILDALDAELIPIHTNGSQ